MSQAQTQAGQASKDRQGRAAGCWQQCKVPVPIPGAFTCGQDGEQPCLRLKGDLASGGEVNLQVSVKQKDGCGNKKKRHDLSDTNETRVRLVVSS